MVVARDVRTGHPGTVPLLRAGAPVAAGYPRRLAAAGIHAVWIDDDLGEGIVPVEPLSPETRRVAQAATVAAIGDAREAVAGRGGGAGRGDGRRGGGGGPGGVGVGAAARGRRGRRRGDRLRQRGRRAGRPRPPGPRRGGREPAPPLAPGDGARPADRARALPA